MTQLTIYTSTVTSWPTAAAAVTASLAVSAPLLLLAGSSAGSLAAALGAIAVAGLIVSVHLATVRLTVSGQGVGLGSGIRGRTRWIPLGEMSAAGATQLSWSEVFGVGLPLSWRSTRLTVRAGQTLLLRLASGERIWVSATDPNAAVALLTGADSMPKR